MKFEFLIDFRLLYVEFDDVIVGLFVVWFGLLFDGDNCGVIGCYFGDVVGLWMLDDDYMCKCVMCCLIFDIVDLMLVI